jgi:hypothetical protein
MQIAGVMTHAPIATYLQDHLAGAVAAIELLQHLEQAHTGSDTGRFLTALRADVAADRAELETLMERLGIAQSGPRKAMAWLAEKLTQLKLRLEDEGGGNLRLLEALDALAGGSRRKGRSGGHWPPPARPRPRSTESTTAA